MFNLVACKFRVSFDFYPAFADDIRCTFQADRGASIGWKPKYAPEHIIEVADAEVELVLKHLKNREIALASIRRLITTLHK